MDAIIAEKHGLYGQDYSPSLMDSYQDEADAIFTSQLEDTLKEGKRDVVLDRAFYAKKDRDKFKTMIERLGGRCVLLYLKVGREELWRRIVERREREISPDSAREISRELLESFVEGFESPEGEGEAVIENE